MAKTTKKKDSRLAKAGVSGYNKPKRTPNHPTKSHVVVAKEGDKIKKLNCNHVYHEECLIPWLNKNDYCPMCRQNII